MGIPDDQLFGLEECVANHVFDLCAPAIVREIYIQNVEGKSLLVVEVYPGSQKPYYLKKLGKDVGTYNRVGSVNRKASEDSIAALGRSLDIFQKTDNKFSLGFMDQTKRKCKATSVMYLRSRKHDY